MPLHPVLEQVTERIEQRSQSSRQAYLQHIADAGQQGVARGTLSCGNVAHASAACVASDKARLLQEDALNIGVVTAYNDMLSAHQPYATYPNQIRQRAAELGHTAQVAGGVPAMCDGVTQGQMGMELSLFSRDVIAMSTAIALSHNMFDAALCLGVCDKIVPGLLIGALSFGHLPVAFVPAGPMPSGLPNKQKAQVREAYAAGEVGRDELIAAESGSYHAPGTCTFYGTANSNQMLMEFMGLQLPGSSFEAPHSSLRGPLTDAVVSRVLQISARGNEYSPLGKIVSERSIVNAIVGLLCTGGSTNHTIHLVAIAAAAGVVINWQDFADLSGVVPLLAQVYPNGQADVNDFHRAGGLGFLIGQLLDAGLLHQDVDTIVGPGLQRYAEAPKLVDDQVVWQAVARTSADHSVLRPVQQPFQDDGGLRLLTGTLGRAVVKVSAVAPEHRRVAAAARIFESQADFVSAFERDELNQDMVAVVRGQGPCGNGMPELHKLSPYLGVLQNRGFSVALLTDGRMSGASGKVLAAIHVTPEADKDGPIGRLQDGDWIVVDANQGVIEVDEDVSRRPPRGSAPKAVVGCGRELFSRQRAGATTAEQGGSILDAAGY